MKIYLNIIFILALVFGSAEINRDVYRLASNGYPLVSEFEKIKEAEGSGSQPLTAFEECIGGVCPLR